MAALCRFPSRHLRALLLVVCMGLVAISALAQQSALYEERRAKNGWWLSRASTCDLDTLADWKCGEPCYLIPRVQLHAVHVNEAAGTVAYTGFNPYENEIVVVFRAAEDMQKWNDDLLALPVPYYMTPNTSAGVNTTGWEVHEGIQRSYLSLRQAVLADVAALTAEYPGRAIFVTGHSLGGAMAELCAVDLVTTTWPINVAPTPEEKPTLTLKQRLKRLLKKIAGMLQRSEEVEAPATRRRPAITTYTFGSPRVGNRAFSTAVTALLRSNSTTFFRVTSAKDPVPRMPPLSLNYRHTAGEIYYRSTSFIPEFGFTRCSDDGVVEDQRCSLGYLTLSPLDHLSYMGDCALCNCSAFMKTPTANFQLNDMQRGVLTWENTKGKFKW